MRKAAGMGQTMLVFAAQDGTRIACLPVWSLRRRLLTRNDPRGTVVLPKHTCSWASWSLLHCVEMTCRYITPTCYYADGLIPRLMSGQSKTTGFDRSPRRLIGALWGRERRSWIWPGRDVGKVG